MKKPKRHPWQAEIDEATAILTPLGFHVEVSPHAYEIAVIRGDGVQLVIYPHTVSSTRNQHARVRDNGSSNRERAIETIYALQDGKKHPSGKQRLDCTFYCKALPGIRLRSSKLTQEARA